MYKFDPKEGWFVKNLPNSVPEKIRFVNVPNTLLNIIHTKQLHKTNIDTYVLVDPSNPKIHYKAYISNH